MASQRFMKGDKVLVQDAGQQYTTYYKAVAQMFYEDDIDIDIIAKFRFVKPIKNKELDWDKEQSRFVVVDVIENLNPDAKNSQLCLIANKKHVYLIGNAGLQFWREDVKQEEANC